MNSLTKVFYFVIIGCLLSGFPEATGSFNPWLIIAGWICFAREVKKVNKLTDVLYFFIINISYYCFFYHSAIEVLDTFFKYSNIYQSLAANLTLSLLMQPLIVIIALVKLLIKKYSLQENILVSLASGLSFALFSNFILIIFPNNWAYGLADWATHLTLLPWMGTFGYTLFIFISITYYSYYEGKKVYSLLAFSALFTLAHLLPEYEIKQRKESSVIGLVQFPFHIYTKNGDIPDPKRFKQIMKQVLAKDEEVDILYYPEGSAMLINQDFKEWLNLDYITSLIAAPSVVVSGYKTEKEETYNTLIKINKDQLPQVYYKTQLFPIGESDFLGLSSIFKPGAPELSKKENRTMWKVGQLDTLPLLCFEHHHAFFMVRKLQQELKPVDLVSIQSNESWVQSKVSRESLFSFIKMQAKELGVYIAKVDSAGPTAVIDPQGNVVARSMYSIDIVKARVHKLESNSFYAKYGASVGFTLTLLLMLFSWLEKSLLISKASAASAGKRQNS